MATIYIQIITTSTSAGGDRAYSSVPNKRDGWNKRDVWKFS